MELLARLHSALGGRYTIERELGHGGMAVVYLAEDSKHGRKVAVKVLRPELAHAVGPDRFLHEIATSARLAHTNILPLYDSGEADGLLFYVMPWVQGESLRDRLDREKQLPLEDALAITREVADALGYAHHLGLVHRDVKPENILFQAGHAVVSDFGVARAVSRAAGDRLTETGIAVGTPAYMSPEQASAADVDARSDIYSLACVLYEMLAGFPPFLGPTAQVIWARKALEPVPSLRVVRDTVPPAVEQAIVRALAKQPADRFPSASAFAQALAADVAVAGERWDRGFRLRKRAMTGTVALVALAAGVTYVLVARPTLVWNRPTPLSATFTRLTAAPGVEWFPALSPDGKWIAYAGEASGNRDIYLLSVGGQNPINLTEDTPEDDDQPAFSPDGELIAFRSDRQGGGIFVMGRTGEAPRRVTRFGSRPTWSHDGRQIAFATGDWADMNPQNFLGGSELWVADVHTGQTRLIPVDESAALPSWSPHGHRIAFTGRGPDAQVWTVSAAGGAAVAATGRAGRNWSPAWSPDGRYLYFVSDRRGSMNLWRVRIDEKSGRTLDDPEPITTPATSVAHISLSADGRRVAYSSVTATGNIQRAEFDPIRGAVVSDPVWITTGSRRWANPEPSPDGQYVTFYSLTEPEGDVYLMRSDATGLRQLTGDPAVDRMPRWSPSADWIAFFSDRSGSLQIWKIRPDGSDLLQLTEVPGADLLASVWSPDGSRMAATTVSRYGRAYLFDPDQPSTDQQLALLPVLANSLLPFSPHSWSPDGEHLAGMVGFTDRGIITYALRSRAYTWLTDFGQWPVWLPDSRRLLFVSGGKAFYIVHRETRQMQQILSAGRDVIGPPALTRDGRALYYTRRTTEADIWLATLH